MTEEKHMFAHCGVRGGEEEEELDNGGLTPSTEGGKHNVTSVLDCFH